MSGGELQFDREEIETLLRELGAELDQEGLRAELFVVGGAAMSLAYSTRRATRDIDAIFEPKSEINAAAARIAQRHGLASDWLNDAVKGFLPGNDPDEQLVLDAPGIGVSVPSPRYLLAMKVAAARVDRDSDDILLLARLCGATTSDAVLDITEEVFGGRLPLQPRAQFLIEELFAAREQDAPPRRGTLRTALRSLLGSRRGAPSDRAPKADRAAPAPRAYGLCGAPTQSGHPCRNRKGSCPAHR